jgi:FdhD protein
MCRQLNRFLCGSSPDERMTTVTDGWRETQASNLGARSTPARRIGLAIASDSELDRLVPAEAPVAIEYNGIAFAVMMATPVELEAFATGFTLAEGLVDRSSEITDIGIVPVENGWILRITLPADRSEAVFERVRNRVSESSCGLCGIESLEQALRPLPPVTSGLSISRAALARALGDLPAHQPLGRETGGCHVAAFCSADGEILRAQEDVGRHNALDKLVGSLALSSIDPGTGFILLSARCSYELVEKTARAGFPMLVTISVPTTLAVERARDCGLTLISLARRDSALVFNDPYDSVQ